MIRTLQKHGNSRALVIDKTLMEQTKKDMEMFANNGLRTLCISYRYVPEEEYFSWVRTAISFLGP